MEKKSPAQLEERAYHIWERAGRPHGQALEHWLQAQAEEEAEAPAAEEKPKRRTRKAAGAAAKTGDPKTTGTRAKASRAKAEPSKAKPKKVAKSTGDSRKTGAGRKRTAPNA